MQLRVLSLILWLCLLFSSCWLPRPDTDSAPSPYDPGYDYPYGAVEPPADATYPTLDGRRLTPYPNMVYVRPNGEGMVRRIEVLTQRILNADSFEELLIYDRQAEYIDSKFYTMYTLAELEKYKDVNSAYYDAEYRYCADISPSFSVAISQLNQAIVDSPFASDYRDYVGDYVYESILSSLSLNSKEIESLKQERNQLAADYNQLLSTATYTYEGEEYALDTMYSATSWEQMEAAWKAWEAYAPQFAAFYVRMIEIDQACAQVLGLNSAAEMYYQSYARDYTPADTLALCQSIKTYFAPLMEQGFGSSYGSSVYDMQTVFGAIGEMLDRVDPLMEQVWNEMLLYQLADYAPSVS
jgi:hypothetical protein